MKMENHHLKFSSPLFILAVFLLATPNGWAAGAIGTTTAMEEKANDGDQCKDVIQESPEFGYCVKSVSQKWPIEIAMIPCCRQFKKMDENCRCEAVKQIVNAAVAAAAAAPGVGGLVNAL